MPDVSSEAVSVAHRTARPLLTLRRLWLAIPFTILAWSATRPFTDNSFLWHVRAGTVQLDSGEVLRTDPFSFTAAGEAWRTQSWLADLGYGWLERATGSIDWAPYLVFAGMAVALALVGVAIWRVTDNLIATFVLLLLLAWLSNPFSFPRPALFAAPLLAGLVVALDEESPSYWVVPPLVWLWASLHGSFIVGIGYVALDGLRRGRVRAAPAALMAIAAASLSAHGLAIWGILYRFAMNREALDFIEEWQPPSVTDWRAVPFFVIVLLVAIGIAARGSGWRDLLVVVPFAIFGFTAARNMLPAAVVLAPFAASAVARLLPIRRDAERIESRAMNGIAAAAIGVVILTGLVRPVGLSDSVFPTREARDTLAPGNVFHGTGVGGLLIFTDWPGRQVYIDDRAELYGTDGFDELLAAQLAESWVEPFERLEIRQAIVEPSWPLSDALEAAGWDVRYADEHFIVFESP